MLLYTLTHRGERMNKKLFIFEFANNHMGDVEHGLRMIKEYAKVVKEFKNQNFQFAVKFQFRDIDTFIHPDFKQRMDLKYVKRFSETRLSRSDFKQFKNAATKAGFKTICTGFDEPSVSLLEEMGFDYVKIASCSSTDWPLLNRVAETNLPIIASMAGTKTEDVDRVVSFFQNRKKDLTIMHCVGQYPTKDSDLQINQVDFLKNRYPNISVGFSTHEEPDNFESIKVAIGKGATVFEKHVAVVTDKHAKNAYSSTPDQVKEWLVAADLAQSMCGDVGTRYEPSEKEMNDLRQFRRGVFVKQDVQEGDIINRDNVFYAWPSQDDQVLANDMSKYTHYLAHKTLKANEPVYNNNTTKVESREKIWNIVQDVRSFLKDSGVVYPGEAKLEISHHYGIDKFYETGITMITVVNREYCKKLIIALPGQNHPEQLHHKKEETFVVLHGSVELRLDDKLNLLEKGSVITIEPGVRHEFSTKTGCVIEEVSSTHYVNDSYYTDKEIAKNKNRKTFITHWID